MTKQQAKVFAKAWIGQLLWEVDFDRKSVNCPDEEKDMIELAINDEFFKLLGKFGYLSPQEIYDIIMSDDSI